MWLTDLEKLTAPKYGLTVRFEDGWRRRGASGGAQMRDVCGVLWHHDVAPRKGTYPLRAMLRDGRAGLSGPLCHIGFDRDGTVWVVGAGKANHAGKGIVRGIPRNGGNTRLIGIEMTSAGTKPWDWTPAQLAAMPLLGAALSDIFGLSSSQHWGHYEYSSTGKIDPAGLPGGMAGLRSRIGSVRFNTGGGTGRPPLSAPTNSGLADVDKSQAWLDGLGYGPGPIDGKFGTRTEAATRAFQTDWGLTTDGLPGPATRQALEAAVSTIDDIKKDTERLIAFGEQIHWRTDVTKKAVEELPAAIFAHKVPLEGDFKGQSGDAAGIRKWYAHDVKRIVDAVREQGQQNAVVREDVAALGAGLIALESKVDALVEALTASKPA